MLFILLWKLVIADRVLAVLAEKAALQQTKRFLIGNTAAAMSDWRRTLCSSSAAKNPVWHAPLFSTLLPVTCVCIWQTKVAPTAASR